jgi:hypothetical protein
MPYADRSTVKATLLTGGRKIAVLVRLTEVVDIRDQRKALEGRLWTTDLTADIHPVAALTLILTDGTIEPIRIISRNGWYTLQPQAASCLEAGFISERNWSPRSRRADR